MNITLANITERVRELGIRKAIGATFFYRLTQILVESVGIGILVGLFPAVKAAKINPIEVLRYG